jgi:hypothetical protein
MTTIPLGRSAYKRLFAGAPEVKLLNRWLEADPANLREGTAVLARPGTTNLMRLDPGTFSGTQSMRGNYFLNGLFNDSLFTVCGENLYRTNTDMSVTPITGVISGTGHPEVAWQRGAGYERLWISDGLLLQFYDGTTHATGTLTKTGTIVNGTDKFEVGGVYYTWGTSFSSSDVGSSSHPFVINPTSTLGASDPLNQAVLAIMGTGIAGTDYSSTIGGENTQVSAVGDGNTPAVSITIKARVEGTPGNTITFTIEGGTALTASGSGHLINGGVDVLQGCTMPDGVSPKALTQVSSYILVSVADDQKFYWINPGETTIDPLNFASKESSPDNILHMKTVGDQVLIIGEKSTENWYATGNLSAPFAPIQGRVYARGAIEGTPVVIDNAIILVGDDGRVYSIGYQYGDNSDSVWGVNRISNNGIEERIRYQIRREQGLTP